MTTGFYEFFTGIPILLTIGLTIFLIINRKTIAFYICGAILFSSGILVYVITGISLRLFEHNEGAGPMFGAVYSGMVAIPAAFVMIFIGIIVGIVRKRGS
ncbi:hypothetical protein ACE1TH_15555 [Shouchella sp. JSM 1781072]|uniref:hypothetical protein n=1 Tax=Bacillaceae TaxID=186817 RepID=UPI0020D1D831|nr:hypothetical protein [Alkalihalobacillus sp. LMS6]UTR06015.1 hypothetical protein MM326_18350 [Alkalihalobacillus sp. LMS6]